MIIGISGKAGCGKDTIGKIIQYLTSAEHDRLTFEEFCALESRWFNFDDWQIKKFAGKLKLITSILTGIPVESLEDEEIKKSWLGEEWENHFLGFEEPYTVRLFLQKLGTEAMRDNIHPNVWVNALMADYKPFYQHETLASCGEFKLISNDILPNWIITDVRFPNEAKAIKDRDGILIRVEREGFNAGTHPSETALDNYKHFDHIINNEGSIADLIESVSKILKEHGIN
jgi:hypothetical protein